MADENIDEERRTRVADPNLPVIVHENPNPSGPRGHSKELLLLFVVLVTSAAFAIGGIVIRKPWRKTSVAEAAEAAATEPASAVDASAVDAALDAGLVEEPPPAPPFNVVLITIDTLRADLGFAGYPRPVSANLDRLAARSVMFERAYSTASYTMKALCALLTGRYASEAPRDFQHYTHFPKPNVFLGERLHAEGVRTIAIHVQRYFTLAHGMERGFDVWDLSAMPPEMKDTDARATSERITNAAIKQLSRAEATASAEKRQLFAWLHYYDPHSPYAQRPGAPDFASMPSTSERRTRDVYDSEVWYTDSHVGRLLDWIASQTWGEATAVIVTADHGEAFGEKGHFRHSRELWEPLVRVPLLIAVPGRPAKRIAVKRSHIDLVPTILELMGITPKSEHPALRGKSLLADIDAPASATLEERDLFIDMPEGESNEMRRAIITGPTPGMKLIVRKKQLELYDLTAEPLEENMIAKDDPRFAEMRGRLEAFESKLEEKPAFR